MGKKRRPQHSEEGVQTLIERDLTQLARQGALPMGHGVDQAAIELSTLLTRGGKAPLLAGDQGVGKSAIVQELARRIVQGNAPEGLKDARVLEVTAAGIFARSNTPKGAAELFEELLEYLAQVPNSIAFVRDVGLVQGSSLVPVLIRALRAGRVRFIFETEAGRANELLRSDETLAERLHLLVVSEPAPERARWILGHVAEELEVTQGVPIDASACDMALRLSVKFLLAQRLPRKAIELLRETVTEAAGAARERVTGEDVLNRFCHATRLPRFMADDTVPLDLDEVSRFFGTRLLGQGEALQAVLRSVALLKAGLNNPRRPLGVFLFAGPTGVGKTHLAKLLAEYLFGSADRLVRLNMADYPDFGDENVLFGNPWAQTATGKRGELSRLLDGRVFTVLLLDEFEKAHAKCHDRFLQLFDEGQFINAAGETVPCNNTLIVCTSNVGSEVYREGVIGFSAARGLEELLAEVERRIGGTFRTEFLNRFDAICHFRPLGKVEIRRIAQREVGRVLEREGIRARQLDVEVAPEVVELLVERGYSPTHGARFLQREIEKTLTAALAVEIARRPLPPATPVKVVAHRGQVHAIAEPKVAKEKEATASASLPGAGAAVARRRLDQRSLALEAEALVGRAAAVAAAAKRVDLEARRRELLGISQAPGFWDDGEKAAAVLRAFRAVDAQLGELDRLRELCQVARRRSREAKGDVKLAAAVRAVEEAAREVRLAEARLAAGGGKDVDDAWLELAAAVDGEAGEAWVRELLHMYLGWAQRRGYEAKVVAEGEEPRRAVLHLHGPGVFGFLSGERGLHRRMAEDGRVAAYVRLSRPPAPAHDAPAREGLTVTGREVKRRPGNFVEKVGAEVSALDERTGRTVQLFGAGAPAELEPLAVAVLDAQGEGGTEVRRYFLDRGARVEDPRTGEGTPRVKDVLRGEIDLFIAAWISRPPDVQPD
ncbi:MAG: AAA family ATPase [Myxococcales bacterium]|nr:AAA family ATPase [Myxococcales bacterium]